MAEDGTSALTAVSHSAFVPDEGSRPRGFSAPAPDRGTSTNITAEIPAVSAGPSYGVLLPDGTVWYPGSAKRLPAPLLLRVVVWLLALAVLLAGLGDLAIRYQPSWANPFRRVATTGSTIRPAVTGGARQHRNTGGGGPGTSVAATVGPLFPQPAGLPPSTTAFAVPTGAFTISVTEGPGHDAWVAAFAITNGQVAPVSYKFQTLFTGQTFTVTSTTAIRLEVAALGTTVSVLQNGKVISTVATPAHVPWNWWFEPGATASH